MKVLFSSRQFGNVFLISNCSCLPGSLTGLNIFRIFMKIVISTIYLHLQVTAMPWLLNRTSVGSRLVNVHRLVGISYSTVHVTFVQSLRLAVACVMGHFMVLAVY